MEKVGICLDLVRACRRLRRRCVGDHRGFCDIDDDSDSDSDEHVHHGYEWFNDWF